MIVLRGQLGARCWWLPRGKTISTGYTSRDARPKRRKSSEKEAAIKEQEQ